MRFIGSARKIHRVIPLLVLLSAGALALFSCAPSKVQRPTPLPPEYDIYMAKANEWEKYMDSINYDEVSVPATLRSAESYLDAKEMVFKKLLEMYETDLALYTEGRLISEPQAPAQDYSKFIRHFRELLNRFNYDKNVDSLYYALGYALYENNEREEAAQVFEGLLSGHPNTRYALEVRFRLAEYYFESGQTNEALALYKKIMETPTSIYYEKAIYKLGWVYYKSNDFKMAADTFTEIVDLNWEGARKADALMDEGLTGIVMSLSRFSTPDLAMRHLKAKGVRDYTPMVLKKLASIYAEETRFAEALTVFNSYIELFPDAADMPLILKQTADIYDALGNERMELLTKLRLAKQFNPTTDWYAINFAGGSAELDTLLSETMLYVFKKYHLSGKQMSRRDDLMQAVEGYRLFLASYPDAKEFREISTLAAEALFDAGEFRDAAVEYEKAAQLYTEKQERGKAAYSAILCHELFFYKTAADRTTEREGAVKTAGGLIEAFGRDLSASGDLDKARLKVADMYGSVGSYALARDALSELLHGKEGAAAHKKTAEFYIAEGNLKAAEDVYEKLLSKADDSDTREKLLNVRFRAAQEEAKAGRLESAAAKFDEAFGTNPASEVAEVALTQAGRLLLKAGNMDGFDSVVKRLVRTYTSSKAAPAFLIEMARTLEPVEPVRAATIYETASPIIQNPPDSAAVLFAAALLYEKAGEHAREEGALNRYMKHPGMAEANLTEALYRLGSAQIRSGRQKDGLSTLARLIELKGDEKGPYAAKAKLLVLKENLDGYLSMKLTQPFEETMRKKSDMLDTLLKEYSALIGYKLPELLPEIFFPVGLALENFRDSILQSERPDDLDKEELEEYNFLLEERAFMYDDKAAQAYGNCFRAGVKTASEGEWAGKCLERLSALKPAIYKRKFVEVEIEPLQWMPEPVSPFEGAGAEE